MGQELKFFCANERDISALTFRSWLGSVTVTPGQHSIDLNAHRDSYLGEGRLCMQKRIWIGFRASAFLQGGAKT